MASLREVTSPSANDQARRAPAGPRRPDVLCFAPGMARKTRTPGAAIPVSPPPSPAPVLAAFRAAVAGVHLWAVDLDGSDPGALRALSEADLRDAARLAFSRDRERLLAGRAAVRAVLAAYRGVPAAALALERRSGGKPGVPGGPPFSFSRSGAAGLLAVGGGRALGVDLERLRAVPEAEDLAARHLTPAEQERWRAAGGGAEAFLRAWTRLEASLKALGVGLGEAGESLVALRPSLDTLEVRDLDLVPGHAAALALGAPS